MFADTADQIERINVSTLAGVAELLNVYAGRLAAIAGIPATRFLGRSPVGMNATGESDSENYALMVRAIQERDLTAPLRKLDTVVAANAGILQDGEPPPYEWISLMDVSEQDRATVARTYAEASAIAYDRGAMDENEVRERLSQVEFFGELEPIDEAVLEERRNPNPQEEVEVTENAS